MLKNDIIESIKSRLIHDLKEILEPITLSDLALATEFQEYYLASFLSQILTEHAPIIIPDSSPTKDGKIELDGSHYDLVIREHLPIPDVVEIWLIQRDLNVRPKRHLSTRIKLKGSGLYKEADIKAPPNMNLNLDLLTDIVTTVFQTGYSWYEETLHRLASEESISAKSIYSFLRMILPSDDLLKEFWLVSMNQDRGCYLVDERMTTSAIPLLKTQASKVGKSPLRMLCEFITAVLPSEVSHSKVALTENKCIDVDLTQSKYLDEKSLFVTSEIAIIGTESISIFPIVRSGNANLLAIFSTRNRPIIEPILERHKDELTKEYERFRKSFNRLIELLNTPRRQRHYAQFGEFVGGVLGGIAKSLGN